VIYRRTVGFKREFRNLPSEIKRVARAKFALFSANWRIVSQGETPEHAEEMIKEAVELWLECADESEVRRRLDERKVAIKELEVTPA
jgi:hypothetical protein